MNERTYPCDVCDEKYTDKSYIREVATHNGILWVCEKHKEGEY